MRYEQISSGSMYPYPDHDIDPEKKGKDWCMSYARAAYYDWTFTYPKGIFANNGGDYEKFRMYALGKQSNTQYKKWLGVDQATDNTWLSIDWSIRPIISVYRDKALARILKQEYDIIATPIDMTAKSELDEIYSSLKAKLAVRKLLQQSGNAEIVNNPLVAMQSGDPMDVEELEMRIEVGEQFNRSKDAEIAIELGFYENDFSFVIKEVVKDLFDCGVGGYKEWLGEDNKPKFRAIDPERVVTSYARKSDFSDMVHAGEVIDVQLVDLAVLKDKEGNRLFTEQQLQEFASTIAGRWGNPALIGRNTGWIKPYDKFKCKVLDLEFYSYNDYVYGSWDDKDGNKDFRRVEYGRGRKSDKYIRKNIKVVYKVKWIIGTEYCYDWGLATDMKRPQNMKNKSEVSLSYRFLAFNFYEMKAQGFMERLIPYLDDYQLTMLKIQNFKNRAVPSGWWIDLDALENIALSKGALPMQPKDVLQMFFDSGVLLGRSKDINGEPMSNNWKPVIPIENTAASELAMFYQDLVSINDAISRLTGYNDITSGNPNPKTLVPGYELADMSTNDALYPIVRSKKTLTEKLASDVLLRMQQGIKKGGISGYSLALNTNILRFIQISPSIALREYGIMLQEKTSIQEKEWLLAQMQNDIANGYLDSSDAIVLINTHNAKQAQMIWAYRVKKAKEILHQNKLQEIQLNNEGSKEAAMVAQKTRMDEINLEYRFKLELKRMELQAELEKERMRIEAENARTTQSNMVKLGVQDSASNAKIATQALANEAKETIKN